MSKKDFAKDVYKEDKKQNKKNKKSKDSDEGSADDFDDQLDEDPDGDDSDMEFDEDDPEFADAFGGVDSELEDALEESETNPKKRKQGFDRITNDLFASADEFAQLLEANESDTGLSDAEVAVDQKTEFRNRRKLGRKKKKFNRKDIDI